MINKLTQLQQDILHHADAFGVYDRTDSDLLPGLHFCPDWEDMVIAKGTPEWDACTCQIKKDLEAS